MCRLLYNYYFYVVCRSNMTWCLILTTLVSMAMYLVFPSLHRSLTFRPPVWCGAVTKRVRQTDFLNISILTMSLVNIKVIRLCFQVLRLGNVFITYSTSDRAYHRAYHRAHHRAHRSQCHKSSAYCFLSLF